MLIICIYYNLEIYIYIYIFKQINMINVGAHSGSLAQCIIGSKPDKPNTMNL